jgi:diguanylate cyclase (GGDEF)-like protein/PAS domain S-box-containing protein
MGRIPSVQMATPSRLLAALGIFLAVSTVALFVVDLQKRHDDALIEGKKSALSFAEILAAHTKLTFATVDKTLQQVEAIRADSLAGKYASAEAVNAALRLLQKSSPVVIGLGWTDASGARQAHSYDHTPPRASIAEMPHFVAQRDNPQGQMFIAPPFRSAPTGKWFTAVSRRLSDPDGRFAGVVSGPVDQAYFTELYRSINLGSSGAVLLLHRDGQLLAREPSIEDAIGKSFANGPLLKEYLPHSDSGAYETISAVDGVPRIAAYKAVPDLPLVVLVSYARADLLGPWRKHLYLYGPLVALFVLTILIGTWMLIRQTQNLAAKSEVLKQRSSELETINSRFDIALSNMPNGLCMWDPDGKLVIANDRYREMYGLTKEQVTPGVSLRAILESHMANGETSELDLDAYINAVMTQKTQTHLLSDGRTVFIRRQATPEGGWIASHEDITEQKRSETSLIENAAELEHMNERFDAAINNMTQGLCMFDGDQKVLVSNVRYAEIYGLNRDQVKAGTTLREILEFRREKGTNFVLSPDVYINENVKKAREIHELADGRTVSIARHPMQNGGWLTTHEDVTDRAKSEKQIAFLAQHDLLTGLANRAQFNAKLEEGSKRVKRYGGAITVMMLDLDKFKAVNDTLGHPAGDKLLVEVAQRLKSSLRETDVLARLGGDEFAIIQEGGPSQHEGAIALALRIIAAITQPFDLDGHQANIGTSIGIALAPEHGVEPQDLLKRADLALYSVKDGGRNDFQIFQPEMLEAVQTQQTAECDLRAAIEREEFELHYQPVMDAKTRTLCGVEALIRWRHPTRGLIGPDHFLPLAESTGLIVPIGNWVLQRACAEAASWPSHIKIAVNISAVQFKKGNLFDVILCTLVETGLAPDRLELEITETALLENQEEHLAVIRQLKNLGISIALDDFGTGYSSVNYLTVFPFDKIKIDKSFTQGVLNRREYRAVVASTLALAQGLGTVTTAEGVETEEQLEYMREAGVDFIQGYLLGRPVGITQLDLQNASPLKDMVA